MMRTVYKNCELLRLNLGWVQRIKVRDVGNSYLNLETEKGRVQARDQATNVYLENLELEA